MRQNQIIILEYFICQCQADKDQTNSNKKNHSDGISASIPFKRMSICFKALVQASNHSCRLNIEKATTLKQAS
tara:strand:- start:3308 stop:3526 length:219 start_codon:yes stop_codon:yes gene_type:complete